MGGTRPLVDSPTASWFSSFLETGYRSVLLPPCHYHRTKPLISCNSGKFLAARIVISCCSTNMITLTPRSASFSDQRAGSMARQRNDSLPVCKAPPPWMSEKRGSSMFDRRGFLKTTFGLAVGTDAGQVLSSNQSDRTSTPPSTPEQEECQEILARSSGLQLLGLPRDWSRVEQGLHPFAPERVLLLSSTDLSRVGGNNSKTLTKTKECIWKRIEARHVQNRDYLMTPAKFDLLVAIIDRLTSFYHKPELAEKWAFRFPPRRSGYLRPGRRFWACTRVSRLGNSRDDKRSG